MIDLRTIRDNNPDITNAVLAKVLFPKVKNPLASLARVLTGKYELRESQIRALAGLLGITPGDLMNSTYMYPLGDSDPDVDDDLM